jgi:hypothetical protein
MKTWAWTNSDSDGAFVFEAEDLEAAIRVVIGMRLDAAEYKDRSEGEVQDCYQWFEMNDRLLPVEPMGNVTPYTGPWPKDTFTPEDE